MLEGIRNATRDDVKKVRCSEYIEILRERIGGMEKLKEEKEKEGGKPAPS